MMRCARTVPIKLVRAASPFSAARLTGAPIDCFVIFPWTSQTYVVSV